MKHNQCNQPRFKLADARVAHHSTASSTHVESFRLYLSSVCLCGRSSRSLSSLSSTCSETPDPPLPLSFVICPLSSCERSAVCSHGHRSRGWQVAGAGAAVQHAFPRARPLPVDAVVFPRRSGGPSSSPALATPSSRRSHSRSPTPSPSPSPSPDPASVVAVAAVIVAASAVAASVVAATAVPPPSEDGPDCSVESRHSSF